VVLREPALQDGRRHGAVRRRRRETDPREKALHAPRAGQGRGVELGRPGLLRHRHGGQEQCATESAPPGVGLHVDRLDVHRDDVRERSGADDAGQHQAGGLTVELRQEDAATLDAQEGAELIMKTRRVVRTELRADARLLASGQDERDKAVEVTRLGSANLHTDTHGSRPPDGTRGIRSG